MSVGGMLTYERFLWNVEIFHTQSWFIPIGRKLFGDGYSGLEYDYRGLINLYDSQGKVSCRTFLLVLLEAWPR